MNDKEIAKTIELGNTKIDYTASVLKGIAGLVPLIGQGLAELIGYMIPNQKLERVRRFAEILEERLGTAEKELDDLMRDGSTQYRYLLEDSFYQASSARSDDRLAYLAELTVRALPLPDQKVVNRIQILKLLGQLTDLEIIWLRSFYRSSLNETDPFYKLHEQVLRPASRELGVDDDEIERGVVQASIKENLTALGLLTKTYKIGKDGAFEHRQGEMLVKSYNLTRLGIVLLKEIGLIKEDRGQVLINAKS